MTNDELRNKILNDIQYIKDNSELLQKRLVDHQISIDTLTEIRSVLNFFRTSNFSFILIMDSQEDILNLENQFSPYKISMEAFIERSDLQQRRENFIANNKKMYEYMGTITRIGSEDENEESENIKIKNPHDEIQDIRKRIKILEEEQKPLNEIIIRNEQNDKRYLAQIDEIKKSVTDLQSSDSQIEINKMLIQTKTLFDEATSSKQLISDEITELKRAKEGHIAYELSKQFGEKCEALKKQKRLHFWMMDIFMAIILLSNSMLWILPIQELFSIKDIELWQHFLVAFSLNLPLIVIVSFHLNEYTKLNKLYEEYENKRIMAATFVNNLRNLKSELQTDEKDLLELIKTPFEKIFDNPVHSIYGNKSGDKNIGLDQLEKFASIFEKMKK